MKTVKKKRNKKRNKSTTQEDIQNRLVRIEGKFHSRPDIRLDVCMGVMNYGSQFI